MGKENKIYRQKNISGTIINGFKIIKTAELSGLKADAVVLSHISTKAKYLHIASDDPENVFAIAFKTVPQDSTGAAHILEHTVLTGSKKYPVRDPFFSMIKRSVSSFMNAFTANDWTMYPFASPNRKDFYNLMDVYLDAVFFPVISRLNFMQEGHRLEIDKKTGQLARQGVVYNEMKGAMYSPDHAESDAINKALFTGNYAFNSGGDPDTIPSLSHEKLVEFHKRFYHPSNSFIYTYGNLSLESHLKKIRPVLDTFREINPQTEVPLQKEKKGGKIFYYNYAIGANENPKKKFQVIKAWITAPVEEAREILILKLLENILLDNASSPLRKALVESGVGSTLTTQIGLEDTEYREAVFSCGLKDILEKDAGKTEGIITRVIKELSINGINRELAESAIHQLEFEQKELKAGNFPRGLSLLFEISESWFHGNNPLGPLEFEKNMELIRRNLANGLLEDRLEKYFIRNKRKALIIMAPDPGKQEKEEKRRGKELKKIREKMGQRELDAIKRDMQSLEDLQSEKEDLSCLPMLDKSDISRKVLSAKKKTSSEKNISLYSQPTNGIVYLKTYFPAEGLNAELAGLVPLFCYALPIIGTKKRKYAEMARLISLKTGGVGFSAESSSLAYDPESSLPFIELETKALNRYLSDMFEIIRELTREFDFRDTKRLKDILEEMKASFESVLLSKGSSFAIQLARRSVSTAGYLHELWNGIHSYINLKKILDRGAEGITETSEKLDEIGKIVISNGCRTALIAEDSLLKKGLSAAKDWISGLPERKLKENHLSGSFRKSELREGWATVGDASFSARVCRTASYGDAVSPALYAASKIIGRDFLHNEIREKGGAYGGSAHYSPLDGYFAMYSYRDPHIARTLEIFEKAADWLADSKLSQEKVNEAVLQVSSDMDRPLSPENAAAQSFYRHAVGLTDNDRKTFKARLLQLDAKAIRRAARRLSCDLKCSSVAVISNENKLKSENRKLTVPLKISHI